MIDITDKTKQHPEKISVILNNLLEHFSNRPEIKLSEIEQFLGKKGFGILLILFSFPMAIPLPYPPGFTTILGLPLLIFSVQLVFGASKPWLPKWIGNKSIKYSHLKLTINKVIKYFLKIEKIIKPRLNYFDNELSVKIIGFICALCSVCIVLPIWLGNAIPSLAILIMALGMLEKDGLIVIIGLLTGIIGIMISCAVVLLSLAGFKAVLFRIEEFLK